MITEKAPRIVVVRKIFFSDFFSLLTTQQNLTWAVAALASTCSMMLNLATVSWRDVLFVQLRYFLRLPLHNRRAHFSEWFQTNENCRSDTPLTEIPNIQRFGPETSICSQFFQICMNRACLSTFFTLTSFWTKTLALSPVFW